MMKYSYTTAVRLLIRKKSKQTKLTDTDSTEYDFKIFMLTLILIHGLRVVLILYPYNLND